MKYVLHILYTIYIIYIIYNIYKAKVYGIGGSKLEKKT